MRKRVKYKTLDQSKKEELLTKNMSYKKTMREEQKHKLLQNKRAKYQVMDPEQENALLNREKGKTMEKFMTLTYTLMSLKDKLKQVHFTYAVCVTEHCIKSQ